MPDGWTDVEIGSIADVVAGGTPSTRESAYWGGGVAWVVPSEVTRQEGQRITATDRTITEAGLRAIRSPLLPVGTVLLTSRATVGAVAMAGIPMAINQGFAALVAGPRVLPEFLMYWCQANRGRFEALASGSTFPEVSRKTVSTVALSLPPLAVQRRIVDLVGAVDEVVFATLRVGTGARQLAEAIREDAFSDPSLQPVPLAELAAKGGIQVGPFGSQLHASDYLPDGVPVVMPQDIVDGKISTERIARISEADAIRLSRHRLQPGDVLLSRRGDLSKRALVTEAEAGWLCGTGTVRVRLAGVAPKVAFESLRTLEVGRWLSENAVGMTLPNLNSAIVGRIPVRIPEIAVPVADVIALADGVAKRAVAQGTALVSARRALLAGLVAGDQLLPASYDRFVQAAA